MKNILLAAFILLSIVAISAQDKYSLSVKLGSGISINRPSTTPLTIEALVHYNLSSHWAFGAGTGYGLYDKISLIPLYANLKYTLNPAAKYNLFADCSAGYGFALGGDENGGFYFNPAFGVQRSIWKKIFSLSVGYELQKLERMKTNSDDYVLSQFVENLNFSFMSFKLGLMF